MRAKMKERRTWSAVRATMKPRLDVELVHLTADVANNAEIATRTDTD